MSNEKTVSNRLKTETIVFLALTFGLTFLLNFIMWLNYDLFAENIELFAIALQVQMLIPASSAIILNLFVFKTKTYSKKARILFYYFLAIASFVVIVFAIRSTIPIELSSIQPGSIENLDATILIFSFLSLGVSLLAIGWIILIFAWNLKADSRKELRAAKLSFGKPSYYLLFSLFFIGYFLLSTILNWVFGLGSTPSEQADLGSLLLGFATVVILGPILAFPQYFGEEYGWRIFLQERLTQQFGRFKGVLLVGLVWGLWHAPMIAGAGLNYPGYPVLGILVFTIFTIEISIPLGLAVFKSKSVWLAAYLHGIINGSANYFVAYFYAPSDPVFSFGIGIYGLLVLGVMTFFFLKSKEWGKR